MNSFIYLAVLAISCVVFFAVTAPSMFIRLISIASIAFMILCEVLSTANSTAYLPIAFPGIVVKALASRALSLCCIRQ
jgi:hypothetical protein